MYTKFNNISNVDIPSFKEKRLVYDLETILDGTKKGVEIIYKGGGAALDVLKFLYELPGKIKDWAEKGFYNVKYVYDRIKYKIAKPPYPNDPAKILSDWRRYFKDITPTLPASASYARCAAGLYARLSRALLQMSFINFKIRPAVEQLREINAELAKIKARQKAQEKERAILRRKIAAEQNYRASNDLSPRDGLRIESEEREERYKKQLKAINTDISTTIEWPSLYEVEDTIEYPKGTKIKVKRFFFDSSKKKKINLEKLKAKLTTYLNRQEHFPFLKTYHEQCLRIIFYAVEAEKAINSRPDQEKVKKYKKYLEKEITSYNF